MIKTEEIVINDKTFIRNYSDDNKYIQKVGTDEVYSEAVDIPTARYTYVETDKDIETPAEEIQEKINDTANKVYQF